jgi:phage terminase small subunit
MSSNEKTLTPQQRIFVTEYAKDLNAARAGRAANFKRKQRWDWLLKQPHILKAINDEITKSGIVAKPSVERILTELMRIAFFDPKELFHDDGTPKDLSEISEDARRCIAGIELSLESRGRGEEPATIRRYKIIDKHKALENLGRHLAMFTDKLKVDLPTELGNMTDDQLNSLIKQLADATSTSGITAGKTETHH